MAELQLSWERNSGAPEGANRSERLHRIRHSCSHIMAQAVLSVFPDAKYTIGPAIATGFYYDFELPRTLTTEDLERIEEEMRNIVKKKTLFLRSTVAKSDAMDFFRERNQSYKLEIMDRIVGDSVTFYKQDTFVDLCAGPHVGNTKDCKHFKLLNVAGAYWRGDENQPQLQRIYGTAWETEEDLALYLRFLEESKKRDHRTLGPKLGLFFFHQWSPGNCFWQPAGVTFLNELRRFSREIHDEAGYEEILNPILYKKELFECSGHWSYYQDDMFLLEHDEDGKPTMALKPMNCPDTMLYFKTRNRSYRELPLRVAEGQILHRNEDTGTLHGLLRARSFCQDDAHIFVTEEHIFQEITSVLGLVEKVYGLFQMKYEFMLSTRPEKAMGDPKVWEGAEAQLKDAFAKLGIPYKLDEGGGAFYGPKIDIKVTDALGRVWQTATVQLDFQLPQRFELEYVGADNTTHRPIVIHRAIFGSIERFAGILLEHLGGVFPTWLAPEQVRILTITNDLDDTARAMLARFKKAGIRATADLRGEKINLKIREAELMHIPYMLVLGRREAEADSLAVRSYTDGQRGVMSVDSIIAEVREKIDTRAFDVKVESFAALFATEDLPDPNSGY